RDISTGRGGKTIAITLLAGTDQPALSGMPMAVFIDIWDTTKRVASAVTEQFLPGDYVLVCQKSLAVYLAAISPLL
ncbi:hypothetical protein, partial [Klebsiella pneumoniae]|uniref:hypothetical protein n=1 Tax=Klebsiella pneumoniae TaxID=573 RepID=UPI00272F7163